VCVCVRLCYLTMMALKIELQHLTIAIELYVCVSVCEILFHRNCQSPGAGLCVCVCVCVCDCELHGSWMMMCVCVCVC
jgi:hypothetical protein